MNLVVSLEQCYEATPDGRLWTPGPIPLLVLAALPGCLRSRPCRRPSAPGRRRHPRMCPGRRPWRLLPPCDILPGPLAVSPAQTADLGRRPGRGGALGRGDPSRGLADRRLSGTVSVSVGSSLRGGGGLRPLRWLFTGGSETSAASVLPLVVPAPIATAVCRSLRRRLCHGTCLATPISASAE